MMHSHKIESVNIPFHSLLSASDADFTADIRAMENKEKLVLLPLMKMSKCHNITMQLVTAVSQVLVRPVVDGSHIWAHDQIFSTKAFLVNHRKTSRAQRSMVDNSHHLFGVGVSDMYSCSSSVYW